MFPRLDGKEVGSGALRDSEGGRPDANKHGGCLIVPVNRHLRDGWLVAVTGDWLRTRLNAMVQLHWSQRRGARKRDVAFSAPSFALFG